MTNIILLSLTLVTNQQQAIVGQSAGKAHLATQEVISQRAELGYVVDGKTIPLGALLSVVGTSISTNLIPIVMQPGFGVPPSGGRAGEAATGVKVPSAPSPSAILPAKAGTPNLNTNSPGFKRRMEREARMRGTNAPASK
jgi:hypothetical protein